ncbi:hypothetical protein WJX81_000930 [Elliptochloris bilobata]|uniref:Uncharacterized protein n=1 Tax=Elliptochloris bilobata TaxID=381761 RepID=A0AAW1RTW5_9CHLO
MEGIPSSKQTWEDVFGAHQAAGWHFELADSRTNLGSRKRKRGPQLLPQVHTAKAPPEPAALPPQVSKGLLARLRGYGLATAPHACELWQVEGAAALPEDRVARRICALLWQLVTGVSAARLAAAVLLDAGWARAALAAVHKAAAELRSAVEARAAWTRSALPSSSRAASALVAALAARVPAAQRACTSTGSGLSPEQAVMVMAELDGAYYALLEHALCCGWAAPAMPPPHAWFPAFATAHPGNAMACERLLCVRGQLDFAREVWGVRAKPGGALRLPCKAAEANPLLAVLFARFQEGARLLHGLGFGASGELDTYADQPWPAYLALRAWRESARECHFYAYAPPNRAALRALAARSPLVEVGAGLGYWAALLRSAGTAVAACDASPPGARGAPNKYHGRVPAISPVLSGGPRFAAARPDHALLLCYPPPQGSMAEDCLRLYRGACVCLVGEAPGGDTGTRGFFRALQADFELAQRLRLPNWSDTIGNARAAVASVI